MSKLQIGLLLAGAGLTSGVVFAGAESSGGLENYDGNRGSAWFVKRTGGESIRACIAVSTDFGYSAEELAGLTRWTFAIWDGYIQQKRLTNANVVTKIDIRPACVGNEDLRILFGVTDAAVTAARVHYRDPIAIPELQSFDVKKGWGRGFVWFTPNGSLPGGGPHWKDTYNLKGALLHEVGHLLGCGHISGTVMAGDLAREFSPASITLEDVRRARLTQIDHDSDLIACDGCTEVFTSRSFSLQRAFRRLLSRDAVGKATSTFTTMPGAPKPLGTLTLSDAMGDVSFRVVPRIRIADVIDNDGDVFKSSGASGLQRGRAAYFGDLVLPSGEHLPMSLERNLSMSIEINILEPVGSKASTVFSAGRIFY